MEEHSWRSTHGAAIMEDLSWRRNHGGAIMEEQIMKKKSWRRTHVGGIAENLWTQRHPRGTQEVLRRHPGGTQEVSQKVPMGAPRKPPASPQRHPEGTLRPPGGSQETRGVFGAKCVENDCALQRKWPVRPFSRRRERRDAHHSRNLNTKTNGRP